MADDDEGSELALKLIVCLIGAASVAVVATRVYRCITATSPGRQPEASTDNSAADLLPAAHKYDRGVGPIGAAEERSCAICLCEFEDGEELRTLPECLHSFHVACIDMWLCSHSSCPMCRTLLIKKNRNATQIDIL